MALQKAVVLPSGASGSYLAIVFSSIDTLGKRASFHLYLYKDRPTKLASPNDPVRAVIAKLRLTDAKFDAYLSYAAITAGPPGSNHISQAYIAFTAEPLIVDPNIDLSGMTAVLEPGQTT